MLKNLEIGPGDGTGDDGAEAVATTDDGTPHVANTRSGARRRLSHARLSASETNGEGQTATVDRSGIALARERARERTTAGGTSPSPNPIGAVSDAVNGGEGQVFVGDQDASALAAPKRKGRAKEGAKPKRSSPVPGGDGQPHHDALLASAIAAPSIHAIVTELTHLQKRRIYCIKEKNGSQSRIEQLIVAELGHDGTETGRKAAFAKARTLRVRVEKGGGGQITPGAQEGAALAALIPLMLQSAAGREPWIKLRVGIEADMERLAKQLPTAAFVTGVRGLGLLGLAVIQAEAGVPFQDYRTVSGLWKRMGLAVIDGRRQRRVKDKEEAIRHGYNPSRRAEMFAFLSDIMFRQQWAGERLNCPHCAKTTKFTWSADGEPVCDDCSEACDAGFVAIAHAIGPYGEVYGRRRKHTAPRIIATDNLKIGDPEKWTPMRCHNDATRVMSKALLRDLFRVSRGLPPRGLADIEGENDNAV